MKRSFVVMVLVGSLFVVSAKEYVFDFESQKEGLLSHWKCVSKWKVEQDKNAHSKEHVLSMKGNKRGLFGFGGGFNLCFNPDIKIKDPKVAVWFRANSGSIDQGGGIIWRVLDEENYYVARFNPLEDNFRFYKVINGNRRELASSDIKLSSGWHKMKIVQKGAHFEGYLDNKRVLECDDDSITQAGSVGVWTKADAKTSFDDLVIKGQ